MITPHGVPLSLYRDRHAIFQRNDAHWTLAEQLAGKQSPTQLGRALEELGIEQIPAYSPQAKGRIERVWRTCQDRLVSELRLARAATLAQANAVLARFCADYNQRFARPAADALATSAPCPAASISPAASAFTINASSPPTTPSPSARTPSPCPALPGHRGYAGETVELSHHLDGMLRVYRGDLLLRCPPLPLQEHAERPPGSSPRRRKEKPAPHLQPLRPPRFSGRYLNR